MSIKINIGKVTSIVKVTENENEQITVDSPIIKDIVQNILNHPELGDKAKTIGEDKLKEVASKMLNEKLNAQNEEAIKEASKIANDLTLTMIKGVVDGALKISKELK